MKVKNIAELKAAVGQQLSSEEWFEVTQDLVNDFARATKDFQWIHIDPDRAKRESPFGGPIAHGFYSLSLIPEFISKVITVESAKMGINYGVNKVRFPHHVPVGCRLRGHCTIKSVDDYHDSGAKIIWHCVVEIEGVEKPACVAEMISLMFE